MKDYCPLMSGRSTGSFVRCKASDCALWNITNLTCGLLFPDVSISFDKASMRFIERMVGDIVGAIKKEY